MTATIRPATTADVDVIATMATHFAAETSYRDGRVSPSLEAMRGKAIMVLKHGAGWVAEIDGEAVGMILALVFPHLLLDCQVGTEVVWWVEPHARRSRVGRQLMETSERWARTKGADRMQFSAYRDPVLERLYRSLGYDSHEMIFEKRL